MGTKSSTKSGGKDPPVSFCCSFASWSRVARGNRFTLNQYTVSVLQQAHSLTWKNKRTSIGGAWCADFLFQPKGNFLFWGFLMSPFKFDSLKQARFQ